MRSQAAKHGLKCIIVQECLRRQGVGQPEIIEKARACEAYGAEVVQLSVGPELFCRLLAIARRDRLFQRLACTRLSASRGIETLGVELVEDCRAH
ncbi:MAG: hypothetical protein MZU97_03495 [Bacillus subtilis]|nr:hypothetical protein [Bacillus subtilis]